ncbi:uncharacterized protein LOC110915009 [Helianthus annuus]|uniref:uncharacterized protein LOC110915009 n=1 Tax=Helianthus annuus TaxID=4232 RepID=UPI000B8F903F|nr:uncharacterized protein LOC110915009 [Helianthus annuus]
MNFLSLNIRGIRGSNKSGWVKSMVSTHGISFLSLQESKCSSISRSDLAFLWVKKDFGMDFVESVGLSRGLICICDDKLFRQTGGSKDRHYLHVRGSLLGCGEVVNILNVYAPQGVSAKQSLWGELKSIIDLNDGLWVVAGDFNAVRFREERRNCAFKQTCANQFNEFIYDSGLLEYSMSDKKYTFFADNGNKCSKLDRFLVNSEFFNLWPAASCRPVFEEVVFKAVSEFDLGDVNPDITFVRKLSFIRDQLRSWKDELLRREGEELEIAMNELESLDTLLDQRDFTEEEEWMKASNTIHGLEVNGAWISKPSLVKKEVFRFFRYKSVEEAVSRPPLTCSHFKKIPSTLAASLEVRFSKEEVKATVFGCDKDRAPGPDGFNFRFFTHFWDLFASDFYNILDSFFIVIDFQVIKDVKQW